MPIYLGNLDGHTLETMPHPTEKARHGHPARLPEPDPDMSAPSTPIPYGVDALIILGDGDCEPYLTHTAYERARARHQLEGRVTRSPFADKGKDFTNVLRESLTG